MLMVAKYSTCIASLRSSDARAAADGGTVAGALWNGSSGFGANDFESTLSVRAEEEGKDYKGPVEATEADRRKQRGGGSTICAH